MADPVFDRLQSVKDADSFIAFLEALRHDLPNPGQVAQADGLSAYMTGVSGWMNTSIPDILDAAIAGARDNHVGTRAQTAAEAWRAAAEIIYLGKIYE